jgi:cytochrome c biogenesis protein CcdA
MTASLILAFSAGMVATVNPCGFAMLPAYLSYFMGVEEGDQSKTSILRSALVIGSVVSAGFLVVFGAAGAVISGLISGVGRTQVIEWIPWLALSVGAGIVMLGVAMVRGYQLVVGLPKAKRARLGGGYRNVFAFGTSYAVASLSCTLPVFLTVVATQFTTRSFVGGMTIFIAYALGMATVLLGLTIVLAFGKQQLVNRLRASARFINKVSGVVLILAGAWIVWFWGTAITSDASTLGGTAGFTFVENLSQSALNTVSDNTLLVALGFGALIVGAVLFVARGPGNNGGVDDENPELESATHGGATG